MMTAQSRVEAMLQSAQPLRILRRALLQSMLSMARTRTKAGEPWSANIGNKEEDAFAAMSAASSTIHICATKMYVIAGKKGEDADGVTHATSYMSPTFGPSMFVIVGRGANVRALTVTGFMKPHTQHGAHSVNVVHLRDRVPRHFLDLRSQEVIWINLAVLGPGLHRSPNACQRSEHHRQTQARGRNCHRQTQARARNRPAKTR